MQMTPKKMVTCSAFFVYSSNWLLKFTLIIFLLNILFIILFHNILYADLRKTWLHNSLVQNVLLTIKIKYSFQCSPQNLPWSSPQVSPTIFHLALPYLMFKLSRTKYSGTMLGGLLGGTILLYTFRPFPIWTAFPYTSLKKLVQKSPPLSDLFPIQNWSLPSPFIGRCRDPLCL